MSTTQTANWIAFAGIIVVLLKLIGIQVAEADVQTLIGAILSIVGIVVSYVNRYKKGDLNVLGGRL